MTERDAEMKGYQFTGVYIGSYRSGSYKGIPYDSGKDGCKIAVAEYKKRGVKAVVVPCKANKYSRGQNTGITGYSVYAEPKLSILDNIEKMGERVDEQPSRMEALMKRHREEVDSLMADFQKEITSKAISEEKLANYKF